MGNIRDELKKPKKKGKMPHASKGDGKMPWEKKKEEKMKREKTRKHQ